ncbi:DNA polymerase/3'-5' exonuclease PolX [Streptomyces sp. SID8366]|uniref:DNA polymerase/3'-5' exonuclease PolX n=1 Tax=unclassified Streptomyces TaxID=2593676 RepID=UPI000DBA6769|nr:DNA polymerase/3'-5' exonuclease PolX [Streptomyces sp. PsTaAH-130]MYU02418.1 DNA polymerase/3'-5' exonuclease PolX [Streptomyces sp. SID8366]MYU62458.1 DNA polymerase/3'-5' exonuclease PolX [Streptomyces sp. SID69]RAJ55248.1 DNA polymerase (family 10) [Streptomyces sp. PsTaAH-130]
MARVNGEVEAILREYADLIAITGGDAFKARAYEKAARAVGGYPADVSKLDEEGLREIPNVGRSIADKVIEYLRTGKMAAVEERRAKIPAGVRELITIPTLGPKKALRLYEDLHISSVSELAAAIEADRLADLKGFGEKTQDNIRHGIELLRQAGARVPLSVALDTAEEIVGALEAVTGCRRCAYAGSLRRMRETVGDLDILVAARKSGPFMAALCELPGTAEVIARGTKKTSVRTGKGLQVDLRVLPPDSWGAGLQYFTGSKAHNIRTRTIAVHRGLKLSEYGVFDAESGESVASRTEEEVYARLGLPWIVPTLREDRGEIEAALRGELPRVVTERDVRGDLHTHTDLTDGLASLDAMVEAAAERGYAYYAVTDHAPDLYMQRMTDEKVLAQRERLRELDGTRRRMRLLHGTELNIGPDGGLDWPDAFLAGFDLCVASLHSHFDLGRTAMTRRLVRAVENPHVNILGHPTTRLIGRRAGVDADWDEVFAACARTGTALEVNAQPDRLDLGDEDILRARTHGVRFAVNTDAHSVPHLAQLRYGIGTAQRGWLTPDEVINTWPLTRLRRFLRKGGR